MLPTSTGPSPFISSAGSPTFSSEFSAKNQTSKDTKGETKENFFMRKTPIFFLQKYTYLSSLSQRPTLLNAAHQFGPSRVEKEVSKINKVDPNRFRDLRIGLTRSCRHRHRKDTGPTKAYHQHIKTINNRPACKCVCKVRKQLG